MSASVSLCVVTGYFKHVFFCGLDPTSHWRHTLFFLFSIPAKELIVSLSDCIRMQNLFVSAQGKWDMMLIQDITSSFFKMVVRLYVELLASCQRHRSRGRPDDAAAAAAETNSEVWEEDVMESCDPSAVSMASLMQHLSAEY